MNLSSQCPLAHSFCFKDQRITEQFQLEETSQISWFHPLPWDLSTCSPGLSFTAVGGDHSHPWSCTHLDSCSPKSCQLLGVLGGSPGVSGAQEVPLHATIPPLTLEHSCGSASAVDRSSSQKPPLLSPPQPNPWHSNTTQHFKTNPNIFIPWFFLGHAHRLPISLVRCSVDSTLVWSCSVQTGQSFLSEV